MGWAGDNVVQALVSERIAVTPLHRDTSLCPCTRTRTKGATYVHYESEDFGQGQAAA
jgi:hypothetical protein